SRGAARDGNGDVTASDAGAGSLTRKATAASMAVEGDQAGVHRARPPRKQPAHLDLLDDDREAQSVVERVGNPALMPGNVAEVNPPMVISDRAPISRMIELAHELEGIAGLDESVDVAPAIHASRGRTPQLLDATGVGADGRLPEQCERIGAALPLA